MQRIDHEKGSSNLALRVVQSTTTNTSKFIAQLLSQDNVVVFTRPRRQTGLNLVHAKHPQLSSVDWYGLA